MENYDLEELQHIITNSNKIGILNQCQDSIDHHINKIYHLQNLLNEKKLQILEEQPKTIDELINIIENSYQKRALAKLLESSESERIYLVQYDNVYTADLQGLFTIMGAVNSKGKREKYSVKLYKNSAHQSSSFWCSCPDHKFNSSKRNMVCKHICFLVCKVAKILDPQFFNTKPLSSEQYDIFIEKIRNIQEILQDTSICKPNKNISRTIFFQATKEIQEDDICPICFDNIKNNRPLLCCPTCNNYTHMECMEVWLERKHTCVYCRSDIWKQYIDILK
jgi:hypothetical protein